MTNRWRLTSLVIVIATLLSLSLATSKAQAATTGVSLTTSPVSLDLSIKPGSSSTSTLHVINNGSQPLQINMQLQVFSAYGDTGQAAISEPQPSDPSPSWVKFSPASFVAQPGVWTPVQVTISLPKTASLGYYYAVIFKPFQSIQPLTPKTTAIKGSNAILLLVDTQSPNESRQLQVASFTVSKKLYEYLPTNFAVTIHNSGNIFVAPYGNIFISKNSNLTNSIATLTVNAGAGNILPNSDRTFTATWTDGFPVFVQKTLNGQPVTDKKGNPIEQLNWNFAKTNHFRFGKYYAQLTLLYNNGTRDIPITGVVSFWVIPWKLLLVGVAVLALVGLGLWSIIRLMIARIRHRSSTRKK